MTGATATEDVRGTKEVPGARETAEGRRIRRVGIVGCGTMGAGIAEVCALAGTDVTIAVSSPGSAEAGRGRLLKSLDHAVRKGRLGQHDRDRALELVTFSTDLGELADRQIVFEAVGESETVKADVFATLDKHLEDPEAVLATNTSSIPVMKLARATGRPERVIGTHFFSPVPAMPLVELVGSLATAEETLALTREFIGGTLGKDVIDVPDRAGFLVNSLLIPYLLAAVRLCEAGVASAEAIDRGMEKGCAHPVGPLRLIDLVGADIITSVAEALHREFGEPLYAPPALLRRMVEAGRLGKKTGRGFYTY
jgi:3-hydroxybutyryl-CoA dehydrogenase